MWGNLTHAFCQALASQGQSIKFSLKIGTGFSFSLNTKVIMSAPVVKKQKSPSAQMRNSRQKKEFHARKDAETPIEELTTKVNE